MVFGGGSKAMTMSRFVGFVVIFLFSLNFMVSMKSIRLRKAQLWMVLFVGFGCISLLWSVAPLVTIERIPTFLSLLLFYLAVGLFKPNTKDMDNLVLIIIAGGVITALIIIYKFNILGETWMDSDRASFVLQENEINPNTIVYTLLLPFTLLVSQLIRIRSRWQNLVYFLGLLVIGYASFIIASRGGFLSIVAILFFYLLRGSKKNLKVLLPLLFFLIFLIIYGYSKNEILFQRLTFQTDTFERARGVIWAGALILLPNYWLFGAGLDSFPTIYQGLTSFYWGPHSIYVGTLLELGIIGIFIMLTALFYHLKGIRRCHAKQTETTFALKATLWGMLVMGASMDILYMKYFWLVLTLIVMLSSDITEPAKRKAQILMAKK